MKYECDNHRAVEAEDIREAAEIFADRKARAVYGRAGYARTLRADSWCMDLSFTCNEAFIGRTTGPHETTGHNIRFNVYPRVEGGDE